MKFLFAFRGSVRWKQGELRGMVIGGITIIFLCLISAPALVAQSAYRGGEGDGYASARVSISNLPATIAPDWVRVFPNSTVAGTAVEVAAFEVIATLTIEVYDVQGRLIRKQESAPMAGVVRTQIATQGWAAGQYMIRLRSGERSFHQRLLLWND